MIKQTLFICAACWAGSAVAAAPRYPISIEVQVGEKTVRYDVAKDKKGGRLLRDGAPVKRALTASDVKFLEERATYIRARTNDQSLCGRRVVTIETAKGRGIGCIGSPTAAGKAAVVLANVLDIASVATR